LVIKLIPVIAGVTDIVIRSAVTISLVEESRGGPFVYWYDLAGSCQKARDLGFDAVEVFPPGPEAINRNGFGNMLKDMGLGLAAVGTGAGWVKNKLHLALPDASARSRAKDYIRSIIDFAGPLGASAIIGSMQGRSGDGVDAATARAWLAEGLEELGEYARQYSVPLIFEPINRYETNQVNSIANGVQLLQSLSTQNVRLLADLFHMNIEEVDIAAALRDGGKAIGHVHFVDSNRRPAGMGHIDYRPIIAALKETGYSGYLSAEALPYPDPDGAARQTIETFKKLVLS